LPLKDGATDIQSRLTQAFDALKTEQPGFSPDHMETIDQPGRAHFRTSADGKPLPFGWIEANDQAAALLKKQDPMGTRASVLQDQISRPGMDTVWFLETNSYDLHLVDWKRGNHGEYTSFDFTHLQYDGSGTRPDIHVIAHNEHSSPVAPDSINEQNLGEASRRIVDQYQDLRTRDGGNMTLKSNQILYQQHGIAFEGDMPHIIVAGTGQPADEWTRKVTATSLELLDSRPNPIQRQEKTIMDENNNTVPEPTGATQQDPSTNRTETPQEHKPASWPKVNFPNRLVNSYQHTGKDGRVWDKFIIHIPSGTELNGVPIDGYSIDQFASKRASEDKINGRDVTISFNPERPVELWRKNGDTRETLTVDNAWDLCKAVKAARVAFKEAREKEPDTAVKAQSGYVLGHLETAAPAFPDTISDGARELALTAVNNDPAVSKELEKACDKFARYFVDGQYEPDKAAKVVQRITDKWAIQYEREFGSNKDAQRVSDISAFDMDDRKTAALTVLASQTELINDKINGLIDSGEGLPEIIQANHAERTASDLTMNSEGIAQVEKASEWEAKIGNDPWAPNQENITEEPRYWIGNCVLDSSLEDESLLCEFVGAPVSGGGVESLVVGPPRIVVEVGAWLFQAGVVVPVYELLLQEPVGGFDHGVVVRVALP